VIGRRHRAAEIDLALFADRHFIAFLVADMDHAVYGPAHCALVGHPVGGLDPGHPVAFGAGIILVDDGPPPFDHLLLDRDRARRGGVDGELQAGDVILLAHLRRELQHLHEHGRDKLGMRHLVFLDKLEVSLRIELLHDDE